MNCALFIILLDHLSMEKGSYPLSEPFFFLCDNQIMKKYNNKIIYQGDKRFDSKREFARWNELRLMERSGAITNLQRQVPFVLIEKSAYGGPIKYVADHVYQKDGEIVVEDVKSPVTAKNGVYRLKKRLMAEVHGIEIKEVY